jgi:hypothetical protein
MTVIAHVGGIPIEETLASFGPALLVGFGVAWAKLRARFRPVRAHARTDPTHSNPERTILPGLQSPLTDSNRRPLPYHGQSPSS